VKELHVSVISKTPKKPLAFIKEEPAKKWWLSGWII
jgi:hypothetical protein